MNQKLRTVAIVLMTGVSVLLTGCVSTQSDSADNGKVMVAPVMPDYKLEVTLARLNEILTSAELTAEQRARFHYDRGVIYDSVGLRILSRIDFHQALKLQPNLADAYNFLGIYYTQEGEFDSAYEAFDAVLELAPNYDYAFLNRGIALYYGQRNQLAVADMEAFSTVTSKMATVLYGCILPKAKSMRRRPKRDYNTTAHNSLILLGLVP